MTRSGVPDLADSAGAPMNESAPGEPSEAAGGRTTVADVQLAHRVAARDPGADAEVFARYASAVHRFIQRSFGPGHDARDMTQEVFAEVYARLPTLRRVESLRSFVFAIAANMVRVELRKRRLRQILRMTLAGGMPNPSGREPSVEILIAGRRAYAAIDRLRIREREAFVLHHLEDLPLPEVARIAGTSLATVKRRILSAQKRLARVVNRDAIDE